MMLALMILHGGYLARISSRFKTIKSDLDHENRHPRRRFDPDRFGPGDARPDLGGCVTGTGVGGVVDLNREAWR